MKNETRFSVPFVGSVKIDDPKRFSLFKGNIASLKAFPFKIEWLVNLDGRFRDAASQKIIAEWPDAQITQDGEASYFDVLERQLVGAERKCGKDAPVFFWLEDHWYVDNVPEDFEALLNKFRESRAEVFTVSHLQTSWTRKHVLGDLTPEDPFKAEYLVSSENQQKVWEKWPGGYVTGLPAIYKLPLARELLHLYKNELSASKGPFAYEVSDKKGPDFLKNRSFYEWVARDHVFQEVFHKYNGERALVFKHAVQRVEGRQETSTPDFLEDKFRSAIGIENRFKHRRILFIGSESYDAPTITIMQGLQDLGFDVLTIKKDNINSWFCNTVVDRWEGQPVDFVLSNLHWGTRWDYYDQFDLGSVPKVLIDGDDDTDLKIWRNKYRAYEERYENEMPPNADTTKIFEKRWVIPLDNYEPDIVFSCQKNAADPDSHYLPFGIQRDYLKHAAGLPGQARKHSVSHIPGPGDKRAATKELLEKSWVKFLAGAIPNQEVYGNAIAPREIQDLCDADQNISSYHRWIIREDYFDLLNNSRIVLYPGIDKWPFWDSKRPWEAYACGCLVLMNRPNIECGDYPIDQISPISVYDTQAELVRKLIDIRLRETFWEIERVEAVRRAHRYFSWVPIAREFLRIVNLHLGRS